MPDTAGNTFDTALDIELLTDVPQIFADSIGVLDGGNSDFDDYYRFRLLENSNVTVMLSELTGNVQLYLYGSKGNNELAKSLNFGNSNETIGINLRSGLYYFRVTTSTVNNATYQLEALATSLGPVPVDGAGETPEKAKDIGVLNSDDIAISEFVGSFNSISSDYEDYYKFELTESSTVSLEISGLSQGSTIILYNNEITAELARRDSRTGSDKNLSKTLRAGTYYLSVRADFNGGGQAYQLKASATSLGPIPQDTAGNEIEKAKDLGVLNGVSSGANEFVGDFNGLIQDEDYYKFEIDVDSTVTFVLEELSSDVRVSLGFISNNENSIPLYSASQLNINNNSFSRNLKVGTYYLHVQNSGYSSDSATYRLQTSTVPYFLSPVDKAGYSIDTAYDLGRLAVDVVSVSDGIGVVNDIDSDYEDYYRFELSESSVVTLEFEDLTSAIGTELSVGGRAIQFGSINPANNLLTYDLRPGIYHLNLQKYDGSTTYQLKASALPSAINSNSPFNRAQKIELPQGTSESVNGSLTGNTHTNYYELEIDENSTLSLQLKNLTSGVRAYVELYNSYGDSYIDSWDSIYDSDTPITPNLRAGTYYLLVGSYDSSTEYELEASVSPLGAVPYDISGGNPYNSNDLGILSEGGVSVSDSIGNFSDISEDYLDVFRFEIVENSTVQLELGGLSSSAYFILNNGYTDIAFSQSEGDIDKQLSANLGNF